NLIVAAASLWPTPPAKATRSTAAARPTTTSNVCLRQDLIEAGANFFLIERTGLLLVPFGEPLREGVLEFASCQRSILVRIQGREEGWSDKPCWTSPASSAASLASSRCAAARSTKALGCRQDLAKFG